MKHGNSQYTVQDNVSNYQNMLALSTRFNIRRLYKETRHCRKFSFGMFLIVFLTKAVLCSIQLSRSPWIKHANCLFYRVSKKVEPLKLKLGATCYMNLTALIVSS